MMLIIKYMKIQIQMPIPMEIRKQRLISMLLIIKYMKIQIQTPISMEIRKQVYVVSIILMMIRLVVYK